MQIKKILLALISSAILFTGVLPGFALAQESLLPLGDEEDFGLVDVVDQSNLDQDEFDLITNIEDPGIRGIVFILIWIYDLGRYILGTVVLLLGAIAAYRIVGSHNNEDEIERGKEYLTWAAIGMVIFSLSWPLKDVLLLQGESFFLHGDQVEATASFASDLIYYILQFIRYILGVAAVYFITAAGLKMIFLSESGDVVAQQKKVFIWGLIGLMLFMISPEIIQAIYGHRTESGDIVITPDQYQGYSTITGISEFLLYFIGALALLGIVVASVIYITSGDNDAAKENSKKIIIGSITGIVIAYMSYTIVAEVISSIS